MLKVKSCQGCEDRTATCHIDCTKYIEAKEEYNEQKHLIKLEKELDCYKTKQHRIKRNRYVKKYGKAYK